MIKITLSQLDRLLIVKALQSSKKFLQYYYSTQYMSAPLLLMFGELLQKLDKTNWFSLDRKDIKYRFSKAEGWAMYKILDLAFEYQTEIANSIQITGDISEAETIRNMEDGRISIRLLMAQLWAELQRLNPNK